MTIDTPTGAASVGDRVTVLDQYGIPSDGRWVIEALDDKSMWIEDERGTTLILPHADWGGRVLKVS